MSEPPPLVTDAAKFNRRRRPDTGKFTIERRRCAESSCGIRGERPGFGFDFLEPTDVTPDQSLARALDERVALVEYDPGWPAAFAGERDRLAARFGRRLVEIRHFGSTAVPGMAAKPVIDLIAGVASIAQFDALVRDLRAFGYHDHAAGNASPADRRRLFRHDGGHRTHQLHLVEHDGPAWRERVGFCDQLNADAGLRDRYQRLKRDLAARFADDRDAYNAHKQAFILTAVRSGASRHCAPIWLPCPLV